MSGDFKATNVHESKQAFLAGRLNDPEEMRKLLNYKDTIETKKMNSLFEKNLRENHKETQNLNAIIRKKFEDEEEMSNGLKRILSNNLFYPEKITVKN